jgi:hypothetical protein
MANFQFYYNLNKHVPDRDSWLGLRPTSWAAVAIGPRAQVTFVVSSVCDNDLFLDHFLHGVLKESPMQPDLSMLAIGVEPKYGSVTRSLSR